MSYSHNCYSILKYCSLVAVLLLITRCLLIIIYRLHFHPLSRYPGPLVAKISDFYSAYHSAMGQAHLKTWQAHERWGPVVRMGPNKLAFNSMTALHEIYNSKQVQKSKGYETMLPAPGAYNTHTCIDKALHKRKRKVISQAFSEQAMRAFEPTIIDCVDIFLEKLEQSEDGSRCGGEWSHPINISALCKYLTLDVLGHFGFGQSFEMQNSDRNHFIIDLIKAASRISGVFAQYPKLAKYRIERFANPEISAARQRFGKLTKELAETRLLNHQNTKVDLFTFIIDAEDPETQQGFTLNELWAESRLFTIAGSDTTATALAATFFYLSRYPECYETLVSDVRSTFKSGTEIRSGPTLARCHYLRACIDETMRMTPPIGTSLWREVCPDGIVVDDAFIPPGCEIGCSLYSVHHNAAIFQDSFIFKPERWLNSSDFSRTSIDQARTAFNPFSLGSRKCVAQNMAYTELTITLAKVLWYYDIRRPESNLDNVGAGVKGAKHARDKVMEFQIEEHLTSTHEGPYLEFRLRRELIPRPPS